MLESLDYKHAVRQATISVNLMAQETKVKKTICFLIIIDVAVSVLAGDVQKEKEAIKKTALNYIDG